MSCPKWWLGTCAAAAIAALAIGCGGSDSDGGEPKPETTTAAQAHPTIYRLQGHEIGPLVISPSSSSTYRVDGKDNSAVSFGSEASQREMEQAATALHGYLVARVTEAWTKACSYLSAATKAWVDEAAARRGLGGNSCAARFAALKIPLTGGIEFEDSEVKGQSLRAKGRNGFLFYRANEAPFRMAVRKEDGEWKLANVEQNAVACLYCDRSYNRIP